jgi:hypothetical protein
VFLIDFSRFTVRAADLLERREADAELLGNSLLRQMKVLRELLQFEVLGGGPCATQAKPSHPARARARGCPGPASPLGNLHVFAGRVPLVLRGTL